GNERILECSETRVVWRMPRGGLEPLRMVIIEPKGGTGTRHVWDDVTGWPTAYPVKNHTPVSILTPRVRVPYEKWLATVTAEAPRSKKRNPTPKPTLTHDELQFTLGVQAYNDGRYDNAKVLLEHVADRGKKFAVAKDLLELIEHRDEKQAGKFAPWICYHDWMTSPMHGVTWVDDDPEMQGKYGWQSPLNSESFVAEGTSVKRDGENFFRTGGVVNFHAGERAEFGAVQLQHCQKCGVLRVQPGHKKIKGMTLDERRKRLEKARRP
ncbi:MAG TPA: hypothetical protein VJM10_02985, partial [Candidatus Methylomirabilis sp.]|nr:hypothetical protein [Candidatus Methylomirabilis sp.]